MGNMGSATPAFYFPNIRPALLPSEVCLSFADQRDTVPLTGRMSESLIVPFLSPARGHPGGADQEKGG